MGGSLKHSLRASYVDPSGYRPATRPQRCPRGNEFESDKDSWEPLVDMQWFKEFLAGKCDVDSSEMGSFLLDYWRTNVRAPLPKSGLAFFAQGARFAASRKRIQQRPKAFYEN